MARMCTSVGGGVFVHAIATVVPEANKPMAWVKARVINRKQVDVTSPAVLECTNCSVHATVRGVLSETVTPVSLSTVHRLSLLSQQTCHLRVGKWTRRGRWTASPTPTHKRHAEFARFSHGEPGISQINCETWPNFSRKTVRTHIKYSKAFFLHSFSTHLCYKGEHNIPQ